MTLEAATKRRVLRKLQITEISAVDNPCQEHARMTIMKRAPVERVQTRDQRTAALRANMLLLKVQMLKAGNPFHDQLGRFASSASRGAEAAASYGRKAKASFDSLPPEQKVGAALAAAPVAYMVASAIQGAIKRKIVQFHNARAMRAMKNGLEQILNSPAKETMKFRIKVLEQQIARNDKLTVREAKGRIRLVALELKRLAENEATMQKAAMSLSDKIDLLLSLLGEEDSVEKVGNPYHDEHGRFTFAHGAMTAARAFAGTPVMSRTEASRQHAIESVHADRNRFHGEDPGRKKPLPSLAKPIAVWLGTAAAAAAVKGVAAPAERAILRNGIRRLLAAPNAEKMRAEIDAFKAKLENQGKATPIRTLISVVKALRKARSAELNKAAADPILAQLDQLLALLSATSDNPKMQKVADKIALLKLNAEQITKFNQNHDNKGRFTSRGSSASPTESKGGKLRRIGRKIAVGVATAGALTAAAFFASPHVFAILDKLNAGPDLTPRQTAGIIKYALSEKRPTKAAESLVEKLKQAQNISGKEAQDKVLKAVQDLIDLRERQANAGAEHVPPAAAGLRSTGFNIPLKAEKAAPKDDEVLAGLKAFLQAVKEVKV